MPWAFATCIHIPLGIGTCSNSARWYKQGLCNKSCYVSSCIPGTSNEHGCPSTKTWVTDGGANCSPIRPLRSGHARIYSISFPPLTVLHLSWRNESMDLNKRGTSQFSYKRMSQLQFTQYIPKAALNWQVTAAVCIAISGYGIQHRGHAAQ